MREVPALRRREPTWKDEVRDRVQRRRKRKAGELPLFDIPETAALEPEAEADTPQAPEPVAAAVEPGDSPAVEAGPSLLGDEPAPADAIEAPRRFSLDEDEDEPAPVRGSEPPPADEEPDLPLRSTPEFQEPAAEEGHEPDLEDVWVPRIEAQPRPVERPAPFADRFEAAAVDAGLLALLYATVIYFASRTAQAELPTLFHAWPWLVGYLAFLGLGYAAWFTGTTGQTPGKMLFSLRVVESDGQPPGYWRSLLRAALGFAGSALLGLGAVPQFFDPARRALHDRLLRTRVVKF